MSVSSLVKCGQLKNIQRPQKTHSEHDNRIKTIFHTASFFWQVHFSNNDGHIKFYKTSKVNLPLTDEVNINTTFHPSEISGFLRNEIYAFAVLWCRTARVGSCLATFRVKILTPCSKIKQSKQTFGHIWICKCTQHGTSDDNFSGTGALVTPVHHLLTNFSVFTLSPQFLRCL